MTIGIVLKYKKDNDKDGLILIADRMFTYLEYGVETEISKIEEIRKLDKIKIYGIGAGDGTLIRSYFANLDKKLIVYGNPTNDLNVIETSLIDAYNDVIVNKIRYKVFGTLGIQYNPNDFDRYLNNGIISGQIGGLIQNIWSGLEIVVGILLDNNAFVYQIHESEISDSTTQGFGLVGSGSFSALWSLTHLGFNPQMDLKKALTLGLIAKFQAEESQGVGKLTDVLIVRSSGDPIALDQEIIESVRKQFDELQKSQTEKINNIANSINLP
ncbi:hypothetical protein L3N51_02066 [Metallosphaera sp. J1]|uniref:energy transducer TonB n=1 Tax=Metallosphaera javensis (ex Hofmann et al. 2022) TaxID=99938 RepID=UPI001EDCD395|nr:hypothetical protein [Metallosphaera javensis (ex Hofmann et al. 2022)]MCG3109770.1 hypothetical protein [Metallosphaera javensis (ex Hofmann et al. 2022)]